KLMIHIEESRYKAELIAFLEKVEHFSFPVEVMNVYEEVAKRFWKYHQTVFEGQADIHMLIIGYEAFGQRLAQEARKKHHESNSKMDLRDKLITICLLMGKKLLDKDLLKKQEKNITKVIVNKN